MSEFAGVSGETDRMAALSEDGIKSCNAGTDSAPKARMEEVVGVSISEKVQECVEVRFSVEVPRLQANDTVADISVPMVQTALKAV